MKPNELRDIEQALHLIEKVLNASGDEDENLVTSSGKCNSTGRGLEQHRNATKKSLVAARNLLAVASELMAEPEQLSSKEVKLQMKAALEKLKAAARGAYSAGNQLAGVERESTRLLTPGPIDGNVL